MNNYEIFISSFIETSSIMLIFSTFNKKQEKLFLKNFIIVLFSSVFLLISNAYFPSIGNLANYIVMFALIASVYKNKYNLYEITVEFSISLLLIILLELLLMTISRLIVPTDDIYTFNTLIIIDFLLLGICVFIYYNFLTEEQYRTYKSVMGKYIFKIIMLNSIIYIICFKLLWEYNKNLVLNYIVIFTLIFLSSNVVNFILGNRIIKLTEEKRSIQLSAMYSGFVGEMISEIKRKQHEFKNHLNAIHGICYTTDEKLIKENVAEYVKSINSSLMDVDELINIDNKILAAVIYNKLCQAKAKNIKLFYSIKSKLDNIKLKEYEVVEVLSDLINNAFEYLELNNISDKVVYIKIDKENNRNFIEVGNYYISAGSIDIDSVFKKGFSTKGENRGYGLYNAKKIVENNGGKIQVLFQNNHIIFKVLF